MELPLDRFVSMIYYYLVKDADQKQKEQFDAQLWIPPKGVEPEKGSVWDPEKEMESFSAAMTQFSAATDIPGAVSLDRDKK